MPRAKKTYKVKKSKKRGKYKSKKLKKALKLADAVFHVGLALSVAYLYFHLFV